MVWIHFYHFCFSGKTHEQSTLDKEHSCLGNDQAYPWSSSSSRWPSAPRRPPWPVTRSSPQVLDITPTTSPQGPPTRTSASISRHVLPCAAPLLVAAYRHCAMARGSTRGGRGRMPCCRTTGAWSSSALLHVVRGLNGSPGLVSLELEARPRSLAPGAAEWDSSTTGGQ